MHTSLAAETLHLSTSHSKYPTQLAAQVVLLSTSIQKIGPETQLGGNQQMTRFLLNITWLGARCKTKIEHFTESKLGRALQRFRALQKGYSIVSGTSAAQNMCYFPSSNFATSQE